MEPTKLKRRRGFTRLSAKRQITLPLRIVEELGLEPGDELGVETDGDAVVLRRTSSLAEQRTKALSEVAGSLPGVHEPGYLDELRNEWT